MFPRFLIANREILAELASFFWLKFFAILSRLTFRARTCRFIGHLLSQRCQYLKIYHFIKKMPGGIFLLFIYTLLAPFSFPFLKGNQA